MSPPSLEITEKSVGFKNVSIPKLTLANSIRNFEIVFQKNPTIGFAGFAL